MDFNLGFINGVDVIVNSCLIVVSVGKWLMW